MCIHACLLLFYSLIVQYTHLCWPFLFKINRFHITGKFDFYKIILIILMTAGKWPPTSIYDRLFKGTFDKINEYVVWVLMTQLSIFHIIVCLCVKIHKPYICTRNYRALNIYVQSYYDNMWHYIQCLHCTDLIHELCIHLM